MAAAAARVLGFFGAEASAAVPVLIDAAQAAKEGVREEAIIALGRIGPEAKAAIPVLQRLMDDFEKGSDYVPEALFALYRLAPDGKRLAEKWLAKSGRNANGSTSALEPKDRVALLGLMGQTSVEGDWWTRCQLVVLEHALSHDDNRDSSIFTRVDERYFEAIGREGAAARLAVPRLKQLLAHPCPWIRLWAREALDDIEGRGRVESKGQLTTNN